MARDFSKDLANYMSLGINKIAAKLSAQAEISVAAWVRADTLDPNANGNRIISIPIADGSTGLELATDASSHLRAAARSVGSDALVTKDTSTVIATNGTWTHVGCRMKFNDPTADYLFPYINGVSENGGSVAGAWANNSFTNGAHTNEPEAIGGFFPSTGPPPTTLTSLFDGLIAEVAVWIVDIGDHGFELLYNGCSPFEIKPASLRFYMQLRGIASPEIDQISGFSGTITGSVPGDVNHPAVRLYGPQYYGGKRPAPFAPGLAR